MRLIRKPPIYLVLLAFFCCLIAASAPGIYPFTPAYLPLQQESLVIVSGNQWGGAVVIPRHPSWIAFQGVEWVWSYAGAEVNADIDETAIFTIVFSIPENTIVTRAILEIAVDNFLDEVTLNGLAQPNISLTDPYSFSYITCFEINPASLRIGNNIISIVARNQSGPAGAAFRITISYKPKAVTKEQIKKEFSIEIVDGNKAWSDRELTLMYEVFKNLPDGFREKLSFLKSIERMDKHKYGAYGSFNSRDRITIFDNANKPNLDFKDDPNGDKEFKGTLLHELTHAFISFKDKGAQYKDTFNNPVLLNYIKAINDAEGGEQGWNLVNEFEFGIPGWDLNLLELKWKFSGSKETPPTEYGRNHDPEEDLCESVMFYLLDAKNFEATSKTRYEFIKRNLFFDKEFK